MSTRSLALILCCALAATKEPQWQTAPVIRRDVSTGYGEVIDDLEIHSSKNHPMRNTSDPGNWAHELTHYVNSRLRGPGENSFYFLDGRYVTLPEPRITISQVAKLVEEADKGAAYNEYLVLQASSWGNQPLYLVDEAAAFANGLAYHVKAGTKDAHRLKLANEFVTYSKYLLKAVKKFDPEYSRMSDLETLVRWYEKRIAILTRQYNGEVVPPPPTPNNFILY